jgi:preprotein translocase subunit SecD
VSRAIILAVLCTACVGRYRGAQATHLEVRLVSESEAGTEVRRFFGEETLRVEDVVLLDATSVREAQLETFADESRHIVLYFDEAGTARLTEITRANSDRRLAFLVDGRVVIAPTIRGEIAGGEAHLTVAEGQDIDAVFDALTRTE